MDIEAWVEEGGWGEHIMATGHTIDEFVAEKYSRMLQGEALKMTKATEGQEEGGKKEDLAKVMGGVAHKMLDHGRNMSAGGGAKVDTTRFYVAFQVLKFNKAMSLLDNGHKEEAVEQLTQTVGDLAKRWGLNEGEVLTEFRSILDNAEEIVAREQAKMKVMKVRK